MKNILGWLTPSQLSDLYAAADPLIDALAERVTKKLRELVEERPPHYMTREEVCEALTISLPTLHEWTRAGVLPSCKVNGRRLYDAAEVNKAVKSNLKFKRK